MLKSLVCAHTYTWRKREEPPEWPGILEAPGLDPGQQVLTGIQRRERERGSEREKGEQKGETRREKEKKSEPHRLINSKRLAGFDKKRKKRASMNFLLI